MKQILIWQCAAILFGIIEGILFHYNNKLTPKFKEKFVFDIHILFGFIRLCLFFPLIITVENRIIFAMITMFTFPFLHDGFYYFTRNLLNPKIYKKSFFDDSITTTAVLSLGAFYRIILFVFGEGLIFVLW